MQVLAKKMIAIMELSQQQLSKQDHYDYGLRSFVIPIARAAGTTFSPMFTHFTPPCHEHSPAFSDATPCHATPGITTKKRLSVSFRMAAHLFLQ